MDSTASSKRRDPRVKVLSMTVRYRSATIADFIENHSYDVSRGGMFIKTVLPFPAGTLLKFEVRIAGEQKVMQGVGRVVWKRDQPGSRPSDPAGMGVKFIKIDDDSRKVIDKLVAAQKGGKTAFEEGADAAGLPLAGLEEWGPSSRDVAALADLESMIPSVSSTPLSERTRTGTMLGLGSSPPSEPGATPADRAVSSVPRAIPPPVAGFAPRPATPYGVSATTSAPVGVTPSGGSGDEESELEEPTMVRQAEDLLRAALQAAGGDDAQAIALDAQKASSAASTREPSSSPQGEPRPSAAAAMPGAPEADSLKSPSSAADTPRSVVLGSAVSGSAALGSEDARAANGADPGKEAASPPSAPRRAKPVGKAKRPKRRRVSVPPPAGPVTAAVSARPSSLPDVALAKTPPGAWQHPVKSDSAATAKGIAWLVVAAAAGVAVYWSASPGDLPSVRPSVQPAAVAPAQPPSAQVPLHPSALPMAPPLELATEAPPVTQELQAADPSKPAADSKPPASQGAPVEPQATIAAPTPPAAVEPKPPRARRAPRPAPEPSSAPPPVTAAPVDQEPSGASPEAPPQVPEQDGASPAPEPRPSAAPRGSAAPQPSAPADGSSAPQDRPRPSSPVPAPPNPPRSDNPY